LIEKPMTLTTSDSLSLLPISEVIMNSKSIFHRLHRGAPATLAQTLGASGGTQ
jgi:hypothetical protein